MEIPGLGSVLRDDEFGWLVSAPIPVSLFGNASIPFNVEGYEDDPAQEDFHAAIRTFLALNHEALDEAGPATFAYYRDIADEVGEHEAGFPRIAGPDEVWDHVSFSRHQVSVQRDGPGEPVYVSVECECSWEPEHGLQLVFRGGARVTKVGPYDGHLTNAPDVVYVR